MGTRITGINNQGRSSPPIPKKNGRRTHCADLKDQSLCADHTEVFTDNVLTDSVTLVSPFTEYGSREDACAAAETSLDAPDSVPGFAGTRYEAASASEMVQITYGTTSPDTGEIMIRKAPGSGDISGNSIPYDEERTLTVGDRQVSVRSTAGQVFVATWEENGYAYALCCQTGLDTETASSLISEVE